MVYLITGEVNHGKTTKLLSIYREKKQGEGFFNRKVYIENKYIGQDIVRISTGEYKRFSLKDSFIPLDWDEQYRYYDYSFSRSGMEFAESIVEHIIESGIEPAFIDEIGPLELENKGLYEAFKLLTESGKELYVVVRESCLQDVIKKFNINAFKVIRA